jgi:predicted aspartyl protease
MVSRRALIPRLALLGAAGGALWLVRDRLPWLGPDIRFARGKPTTWLPVVGDGVLLEVDVQVNGTAVRAVIDSGAQVSAVDAALAQRLKLPRTTALPFLAYGVSGDPALTHTVALDLAVPGFSASGVRAATLDLHGLSGVGGRDFAMLIGHDILSRMVVEANMPARQVRLLPPGAYQPPRDGLTVPIQMRHGAPLVAVRVEGGPAVRVLLDTGASNLLALSSATARRIGLAAADRQLGAAASVGVGGVSINRQVRVRTLDLGALTVRDAPVQIYAPSQAAKEGLLGSGFLRGYRYALDLPGRQLVIIPPTPLVVPAPRRMLR